MRQTRTKKLLRSSMIGMTLLPAIALTAQNVTDSDDELGDDIYLLSPFEVSTDTRQQKPSQAPVLKLICETSQTPLVLLIHSF
jgi:hypothetical protein